MAAKFKTADMVCVIGSRGNPVMTINFIARHDGDVPIYSCHWKEEQKLKSDEFSETILELAPPPRKYGTKKFSSQG